METIHERFFQLAGLIRHEYWLHQQVPEEHGFVADPDTLTIRANDASGRPHRLALTDEMLRSDLQGIARAFYKRDLGGKGSMLRYGKAGFS